MSCPGPGSTERLPTWARPGGVESTTETVDRDYPLRSLDPGQVLEVIDLTRPALSEVAAARRRSGDEGALSALLAHYRRRFPSPRPRTPDPAVLERAAQVARHVLQWGPYEEADYGPEMNWEWDPRGDIEWVAAVYRFYWAAPLAEAWAATRDETYARAFVDLSTDWIRRHPLEERRRTHPVYTHWQGFAWLDLQTGIRAGNLCHAFRGLAHSEAVTPQYLALFLASLYDHQVKTEHIPMGIVHNKAVFEQRGAVEVATDFPEFADTRRWLGLSRRRTEENLLAQTTADGVQREWSFGYHMAVLRDAVLIEDRLAAAGLPVSPEYAGRLRRMHEYCLGIASPFLDTPLFGDASRPQEPPPRRPDGSLYGFLKAAGERYGDRRYAAVADLGDPGHRPAPPGWAFPRAGLYALRSGWGPEDVYLALHCSPRAISGHDQPDNGTFELAAFGRWLMPDTGFYTYGHDPAGRAWHRRTAAHQTLALGGADSAEAGRHGLWRADPEGDVLIVENEAYPGLLHRRTVWFPGRRFFVLLDEAVGSAAGALALHFQLAPGGRRLDLERLQVATAFDRDNVLVAAAAGSPVELGEEEGWWAWSYGHREPRPAFQFRHREPAPAAFLTLVVPYAGADPPAVQAALPAGFRPGDAAVQFPVTCGGRTWNLGRDLGGPLGWCRPG
ncbi:MAG: alginate lyase family protein [Gemmatimonadota bacterium]